MLRTYEMKIIGINTHTNEEIVDGLVQKSGIQVREVQIIFLEMVEEELWNGFSWELFRTETVTLSYNGTTWKVPAFIIRDLMYKNEDLEDSLYIGNAT